MKLENKQLKELREIKELQAREYGTQFLVTISIILQAIIFFKIFS